VSVEYTRDKLSSAAAANVPPGTTVLMGYSHKMHSCVNKPALGFGISSQ
jgi:hypothetical protein